MLKTELFNFNLPTLKRQFSLVTLQYMILQSLFNLYSSQIYFISLRLPQSSTKTVKSFPRECFLKFSCSLSFVRSPYVNQVASFHRATKNCRWRQVSVRSVLKHFSVAEKIFGFPENNRTKRDENTYDPLVISKHILNLQRQLSR